MQPRVFPLRLVLSALFVLWVFFPTASAASTEQLDSLEFRLVGPWQCGQVTTSHGDGVWKSTDGGQLDRLADLKTEWAQRQVELRAIETGHLEPINARARERNLPHVIRPKG